MTPLNVLLVVLDDVGVDELEPYQYGTAPPTPHLQALADEGLRFDRVWATPLCSPSRAALLTGQFADRSSVGALITATTPVELPLEAITLPELLDLSGQDWSAAAVGKWHLSSPRSPSARRHPLLQGFDRFAGTLGNIAHPAQESDAPGPRSYYAWERVDFEGSLALETTFSTTRVVDDAIEALGTLSEPFLLYVALHAAHVPLSPPPRGLLPVPLLDPKDEEALYDANVSAADAEIGRLLGALGERRDRTLIIVLGDNGTPQRVKDEESMEGAKGSFHEGGLRVPLLLSGPPVTARGSTDALVSLVDLYPTLADLAGVPRGKRPPSAGRSLVPLLTDPDGPHHDRLYTELRRPVGGPPHHSVTRAARDASLKVVDDDGVRAWYRVDDRKGGEILVARQDLSGAELRRIRKLERLIEDGPY